MFCLIITCLHSYIYLIFYDGGSNDWAPLYVFGVPRSATGTMTLCKGHQGTTMKAMSKSFVNILTLFLIQEYVDGNFFIDRVREKCRRCYIT